ncbi:MAG: tetratricopeptide repeat protein [Microcoleaceae cyanobacterium]
MVQEFVRQEPIGDKVKMQTARESIKRGIALGEQGRWQEAILEYRRAVELDDQNPRFWLGLGNALSEAEEWQEAVDCYQRVIQLRPEAAQGHHGLGDALAKLGQWPEAEIAYRQAIRLRPDFSWSYNNLGDVLRQLQKWDEAVAAYQRAIELNPEFVWSHHNLAEGLVKLERWAEAEKAYHQLMELKPDLPHVKDKLQHVIAQQQQLSDIKHEGVQGKELPGRDNSNENSGVDATLQGQAKQYFDQGEALRSQGQWEAARNCYYKVVQSEPRYRKAHHHLGDACLNLEQYQDAVSAYRHALKYNPQSTWSYYNLGITLQKLGQRKAAFNCHQKIIEIDPRFWEANLVDSSILRQNLHQASPPPIQNHQHDHPVERDQLASDLPPTVVQEIPKTPPKTVFQESVASLQSIEICFERAKLLTAEARPQEALEYYRRAIELEPQNWQVYHQLGDYWMGQEAWKSALVEYRKAISLNADAEWSHCNLGRALCHLNAVEEGINTLRHAIEVNPASGWMSFYLGEAQFQAEDWDGAIAAYRRSIELMPDSSQFQQRLGDALHQKSKGFAQQALAIYLETIKADPDNIELYHKAIAIKPFDANLYVQLCRTLIRQGQFSQAIVFYQMGLQAVIDDPDIYPQFDLLEIGNLCAGQEKYQEAVFFYQEGLNIEPENDLLGWQIQNIRAIQNREFAYPIETAEYIRLKEIQALSLPTSKTPTISIIIPVYNQILHTYNCLRSIAATMDGSIPYEVIVMDDHSKDHTQEVLAQIQGVQSVFNEQNLGFIGSCNRGASLAKGQYLFFLNNDTVVMPSCFEELLETFRLFPRAGLVGAKFLYPNGMLQEAGGIIWQDGSAWNYGRQDHPNKPEYCYLREVDYCSGAGIMIPRELWNQIGGFDVRLKPAYYEDTDLAFEVRQAGYQVLYQPLAQIIHFEGISSGTDLTKGMKQYQVVNHQKFLDKWAAVLQGHRPNAVEPYLERERPVQQRLLMIDARMLTPDQDSGSLTACNLIKIFQALGYKVTFAPDNLMYVSKYTEDLQRIGVECLYCSHVSSMRSY